MPTSHRRSFLLLSSLSLLLVPLAVSFLIHGELPADFGSFPPPKSEGVPGFNPIAFALGACIALAMTALIAMPRWFGFKRAAVRRIPAAPPANGSPAALPWWFWGGLAVWLFFWALAWGKWSALAAWLPYAFVPMWWGYIAVLDGIVYRRAGGRSLLSRRRGPSGWLMLAIAISSACCWYLFEYLDYFVFANWYYPNRGTFSTAGYVVWFALAYTTVFASVFEWYNLLTTFAGLRARYADGPRFSLGQRGWWRVFWAGLVSLGLLVVWPGPLFPLLWISPLLVLVAALHLAGRWTPLTPLARGNWSPVILVAVATLANYALGEMWNVNTPPFNPNFWQYDVPYVNVLHIFEMPLLGYFGYLPFGVICWVWWLHNAALLGLNPDIEVVASADRPGESQDTALGGAAPHQPEAARNDPLYNI